MPSKVRLLLLLVLVLTGAPRVAAQEATPQPLPTPAADLAEMALSPDDLEQEGLSGFAISTGTILHGGSYARLVAGLLPLDLTETILALSETSFQDAYALTLEQQTVPGNPAGGVEQTFTTVLVRFEDDDSSLAILSWLSGMEATSGYVARITQDSGPSVIVVERIGNIVALLVLDPAEDDAAPVRLLDRLKTRIALATADLSHHTLRLKGPKVASENSWYGALDGAFFRSTTQTEAEFSRFVERHPGVLHSYRQTQVLTISNAARLQLRTVVFTFESEDQAEAWANDAIPRQEQLVGIDALTEESGYTGPGTALSYTLSSGHQVRQITIQSGTLVATIDSLFVEPGPGPSLEFLAEISTMQQSCLIDRCLPAFPPTIDAAEATPEATPIAEASPDASPALATPQADTATPMTSAATPEPVEIATPTEPAPTATSEPAATATPALPTATPEPTLIPTVPAPPGFEAAQDARYGIRVEYDPATWSLVEHYAEGTRSGFVLGNGVSTVIFEGETAHAGDSRSCFEDAVQRLETDMGATNVAEVMDVNGASTIVITETTAQGIYRYNAVDGTLMATFVYCTVLTPGELTFLAIGSSPGDVFPQQLPIIADLIASTQLVR